MRDARDRLPMEDTMYDFDPAQPGRGRGAGPDLRTEAEKRRDQVWSLAGGIKMLVDFTKVVTAAFDSTASRLEALESRMEALERREGRSGE